MIKVITGIRMCGKAFLLFNILKRYLLEKCVNPDHIIEIADGIDNDDQRDPKECFKFIRDAMKDDGRHYLLLDEVQFMPRFEEVLNSLRNIPDSFKKIVIVNGFIENNQNCFTKQPK